jgi:hypothetical protein
MSSVPSEISKVELFLLNYYENYSFAPSYDTTPFDLKLNWSIRKILISHGYYRDSHIMPQQLQNFMNNPLVDDNLRKLAQEVPFTNVRPVGTRIKRSLLDKSVRLPKNLLVDYRIAKQYLLAYFDEHGDDLKLKAKSTPKIKTYRALKLLVKTEIFKEGKLENLPDIINPTMQQLAIYVDVNQYDISPQYLKIFAGYITLPAITASDSLLVLHSLPKESSVPSSPVYHAVPLFSKEISVPMAKSYIDLTNYPTLVVGEYPVDPIKLINEALQSLGAKISIHDLQIITTETGKVGLIKIALNKYLYVVSTRGTMADNNGKNYLLDDKYFAQKGAYSASFDGMELRLANRKIGVSCTYSNITIYNSATEVSSYNIKWDLEQEKVTVLTK